MNNQYLPYLIATPLKWDNKVVTFTNYQGKLDVFLVISYIKLLSICSALEGTVIAMLVQFFAFNSYGIDLGDALHDNFHLRGLKASG